MPLLRGVRDSAVALLPHLPLGARAHPKITTYLVIIRMLYQSPVANHTRDMKVRTDVKPAHCDRKDGRTMNAARGG